MRADLERAATALQRTRLLRAEALHIGRRTLVSIAEAKALVSGRPLKRCACGLVHGPRSWEKLPHAGYQQLGSVLGELRHCACGSTIMLVLKR